MKRCIFTLIFYVLVTAVIFTSMFKDDSFFLRAREISVWDGSTAESFESGSGTKNDPYIIKTPAQLVYFAKNVSMGTSYEGNYIKLCADIVMNDEILTFDPDTGLVKATDGTNVIYIGTGVKGDNSGDNDKFDTIAALEGKMYISDDSDIMGSYSGTLNPSIPIGTENYAFSGVFDGGHHTISGLYIRSTSLYDQGLFGYLYEANVKNVSVENSYIYSRSYSGSIVGRASFSTIENCVGNSLVFSAENAGGIAGNTEDTEIISSYNTGTVAGNRAVGGIVGTSSGDIRDCYNTGNIIAEQMAGGAVGRNYGGIRNFYNTGTIKANSSVGAITGTNAGSLVNVYYSVGSVLGDPSGLTSAQMKDKSSFSGFDFQNVWKIESSDGYEYPALAAVEHKGHIHTYDNDCDRMCNGCDYTREVEHSYSSLWAKDENSHYFACIVCGDKKDESAHSYDDACDGICEVCSYVRNTAHSYNTEFSSDKDYHWYECSVCGSKNDIAEHTPGKEATETKAQTCTVCGYTIKAPLGHTHSYDSKWKSNKENHYKECSCGVKSSLEAHKWNSGTVTKEPDENEKGIMTYVCTVCAANKTEDIEKLPVSSDIPEEKPQEDPKVPDDSESEDAENGENGNDSEIKDDDTVSEKDETDTAFDLPKQGKENNGPALAISISALAVSVLNLVLFAVIIILLLKKNKNRGND